MLTQDDVTKCVALVSTAAVETTPARRVSAVLAGIGRWLEADQVMVSHVDRDRGGVARVGEIVASVGVPSSSVAVELADDDGHDLFLAAAVRALSSGSATARAFLREELVPDGSWFSSRFVAVCHEPAGLGPCVYGLLPDPMVSHRLWRLSLSRRTHREPFNQRDRMLVAAMLGGIEPLLRAMSPGPGGAASLLNSLAPRHRFVVLGLVQGQTPRELAHRQGRSLETIRTYIKQAHRTLGVHSREELVALCMAAGVTGVQRSGGRATTRGRQTSLRRG